MTSFSHLIGSFHMMSQAKLLCWMGSGRLEGMSLMAEMRSSPSVGGGMPPWTQNTWHIGSEHCHFYKTM